jgi:hypothetical protein
VRFCTALLLSLFVPTLLAQSPAEDPNKVILSIGSTSLTVAQYNQLVDGLPQQNQSLARGARKRQFAEYWVQDMLLAAEAEKRGLDKDPALRFQLNDLMAGALFADIQKNTRVDDAALQAYYDAHRKDFESVTAKDILIRVKGSPLPGATGKPDLTDEQALAKATEVRAKLAAGADFAAIAKADSDDPESAAQGGDLGEFRHGMKVSPLEDTAFALKVGEISQPVKSPFGYYIVAVTEHKLKTLAEAKPDIEKTIRFESALKAVQSMREKAAFRIDDGYFGPAAPGPPKPPE